MAALKPLTARFPHAMPPPTGGHGRHEALEGAPHQIQVVPVILQHGQQHGDAHAAERQLRLRTRSRCGSHVPCVWL